MLHTRLFEEVAGIIGSYNEPNRLANRLTNEQAHHE